MKSLSVIFILSIALMLIAKGEVYFGFIVLLFTFFTAIKSAASSSYGDFSKTAEEINAIVQSRKKGDVDIDYLSYPEQLAMKEKQGQQRIRDRVRVRAKRKAKANRIRRVYLSVENNRIPGSDSLDDDTLMPTFISSDLYSEDDFFNNDVIIDSEIFDWIRVNPSTGLPLLGNSGIDVAGHCIGQSYLDDNLSNDCFSLLNDSFSSCDDTNDYFTNSMDEW
ncbi:MAG: hypothetical protein ACI88H_001436 [Cocleimonas sp.]|jgi:hypothetical protein